MPKLERDGYRIAYEVHGTGRPVVLLHGVTVSFAGNFAAWGWIDRLGALGLQVIGMDFRGHGKSDKPREPHAYGTSKLAGDVLALLDHLNLDRASVVGYSLGSGIALELLHRAPQRFGPSVLMATGDGLLGHPPYSFAELSARLIDVLARDVFPQDLPAHESAYWTFAEKVGGDRLAALAAMQAAYPACTERDAARITARVLVVSGEADPVLGQGPRLAQAIQGAKYVEIPGADHFVLCRHEAALAAVEEFFRSCTAANDA